jgi:hypothetical protein
MALEIGSLVGDYEILSLLGTGGVGRDSYQVAINHRVIKQLDRSSTGRRPWSEAPLALGANGADLSRRYPLPLPGFGESAGVFF